MKKILFHLLIQKVFSALVCETFSIKYITSGARCTLLGFYKCKFVYDLVVPIRVCIQYNTFRTSSLMELVLGFFCTFFQILRTSLCLFFAHLHTYTQAIKKFLLVWLHNLPHKTKITVFENHYGQPSIRPLILAFFVKL